MSMISSRSVRRVTRMRRGAAAGDCKAASTPLAPCSIFSAAAAVGIIPATNSSWPENATAASATRGAGWNRFSCLINFGTTRSPVTTTFSPRVVIWNNFGAKENGSRTQPCEAG